MIYKLPEGWEEVKLGDVVELTMGQSPKSKYYNESGDGVPFLQGNSTFGERHPKIERFTTKPTRIASKNDILMSVRAPVGDLNICNVEKLCIGRGLCSIRMKNNKQDFLYYLLRFYMKKLRNRESGTVFPSVNKRDIESLLINLPPLTEQKAIADTLSILDDKIELNSKINKNLEDQAQTIFKHWFIDFEFPDENGNPYKSSGGEMVESELGVIPKGWEVVKLNSLIDRIDNRGKTPPYAKEKTKFPLLDVATLRGDNRIIDYNKVTKYVSEKTYNTWFRSGHPKSKDILISTVGSLAELKLFIGNIGCIAQNVVALRSKGISECYLYEYLKFIKKDLASYDIGSVQPSIKITHIINHPILVPEEKCIQRYHDICKKMTNRIYLNSLENQTLSQLRDTLLPKLMSGEIRVALEEQ